MTGFRWQLLRAGRFSLDAGSMMGLIPRVVWEKSVPIDDRHRVQLQHNCIYAENTDADGNTHRVLIETGTGNKLDAKMRKIFALQDRWVGDALAEIGVACESITDVVVSHLHFDHAGGLTRLCKDNESPDWVGPGSDGAEINVKRSFPNARVHTQQREWDDAIANRSVMTRTYYRDHLEPIETQVVLHDSHRPFPAGLPIDRDMKPRLSAMHRTTEVLPGVRVLQTPGHTWGQQAVLFDDDAGNTIVFTPDVMPTRWHCGAAYSLAYDVEPYTSMISKSWLLAEAAKHNWVLVLDHEPGQPCVRVHDDGHGWFALEDADVAQAKAAMEHA
ncbi:MAG: MBL fold metallo-hydrolase [Phycisphaeraceae bacterium]|nr:MBL fold metallo-hydrolase [Phycisphaerales bacterium]MCB9860817.1 MBL fold metallo-hydrolase [Phycisphaeraceae bacterium]